MAIQATHGPNSTAAPLPSPRLQCIKDHYLAATTAFASPIRPQIASLESSLSDLPFYEISSSSDIPRTPMRCQISRRHSHAPPRAATRVLSQSRAATCVLSLPRASTRRNLFADVITCATSALAASASTDLLTSSPRHPVTSSA